MISRVTADFSTPELAGLAMQRVRESVEYVYSAKVMYNRLPANAALHRRSSPFPLIPAYYNSHNNYLTSVMDSPVSDGMMPSGRNYQKATACIVCGSAAVDNVISVLNAMGGSNIRFAQ